MNSDIASNLVPSTYEERQRSTFDPLFRASGHVWDAARIKSPKNVGRLAEMIRIADPADAQGWQAYYFNRYSIAAARIHAASFHHLCRAAGVNLTAQQALDFFTVRILDQTFHGFLGEKAARDVSETASRGGLVRFATYAEDARYHVDLIIESSPDDEEQHAPVGVQVKPPSFFHLPASHYAKRDNARGNALFTCEMGGEVIYLSTADTRAGIFRPMPRESYAYVRAV